MFVSTFDETFKLTRREHIGNHTLTTIILFETFHKLGPFFRCVIVNVFALYIAILKTFVLHISDHFLDTFSFVSTIQVCAICESISISR